MEGGRTFALQLQRFTPAQPLRSTSHDRQLHQPGADRDELKFSYTDWAASSRAGWAATRGPASSPGRGHFMLAVLTTSGPTAKRPGPRRLLPEALLGPDSMLFNSATSRNCRELKWLWGPAAPIRSLDLLEEVRLRRGLLGIFVIGSTGSCCGSGPLHEGPAGWADHVATIIHSYERAGHRLISRCTSSHPPPAREVPMDTARVHGADWRLAGVEARQAGSTRRWWRREAQETWSSLQPW